MVCLSATIHNHTDSSRYTTLHVGTPPQALEVDLDMLTPDYYHLMTTSGQGSKFDTFSSSSFGKSPPSLSQPS